jgi:uncharacterized protein
VERIGTLRSLRRYPVKSMAGENLDDVRITFAGLLGDRVYAFVDKGNRSNFPWMTGRQGPELILFRPQFLDPPPIDEENPNPEQYRAEVTTPDDKTFRIDDPLLNEYLEQRFGRSLRLRFSERCMHDSRPVSLFGVNTVRALAEETGMNLDARRFRANFYVEWASDEPFFEDSLIGRTLRIGDTVIVQAVKKTARCVMITLDPENAAASPGVLEKVARNHRGCAGIYGAVLHEGIVRVHDPVHLA